jgi:PAS domain S-box-containing protein
VLVVEDEQIVALELRDQLRRMGHVVVDSVPSGEEAVEVARRSNPDLVLMDIKLQGRMDGIEAAEKIRVENDSAVVYLSAFADEPTLDRAKVTQPYGYVLKPFQERELQIVVEVALYRHRVARQLRAGESWRRALMESVGDAVVASGSDGRVRFVNPQAERLLGIPAAEAEGMPLDQVVRVEELPERRRGVWRDTTSLALQARDGTRHVIELKRSPISGPSGEQLGTVCVFRDVSHRRKMQDRLRFISVASGELSAAVVDRQVLLERILPLITSTLCQCCVIHLRGEAGTFVAAASNHREPEQQALLSAWIQGGDSGGGAHLPELISGGSATRLEGEEVAATLQLPVPAGAALIVPVIARGEALGALSLLWTETASPLTLFDVAVVEELGRRLGTALDNAQLLREAQRALEQRDEVLAIVSHDLKTPLATVELSADLLLRQSQGQLTPWMDRKIRVIAQSAVRMESLIVDLLDVVCVDSGKLGLKREPCRPAEWLEETLSLFEALAAEAGVTLKLERPIPEVTVSCDRRRLLQAMENLVGNALKLSPSGSAVVLSARTEGGLLVVSVRDAAGGIDASQLSRLFERHWQAPQQLGKGSGLGLYITKGIVEAHGGKIWAESTPGVGSTFHFSLPLEQA